MTTPFPYSPAIPYVSARAESNRGTILMWLVLVYVALMQVQVQVVPGFTGFRVAPADACLLVALILVPGQLKYRRSAWSLWHGLLLAVFAVGTMVDALSEGVLDRYIILNKDIGIGFLFLSYLAFTSVATDWSQIRRILRVFTISVAIENTIAVVAYLIAYRSHTDNLFTNYGATRLSGLMVDPNAYGGLLVTALVISEGTSWGSKPLFTAWSRVLMRTSLGLGILFTFSRSSWIALGLALLLFCTVRRGLAFRLALGGALGVAAVFAVMGSRFLEFFQRMASRPQQIQDRFDLIHDAWVQFEAHPWLGGGLGRFFVKEGIMIHNTAFWFLADLGIVGLLVFIGFVVWFAHRAWLAFRLSPREERPVILAAAMAHLAILGLMMGIEGFYQRHWWMILALIAAGYTQALKSRAAGATPLAPIPAEGRQASLEQAPMSRFLGRRSENGLAHVSIGGSSMGDED